MVKLVVDLNKIDERSRDMAAEYKKEYKQGH